MNNPYAPPVYNGLDAPKGPQDFTYVYDGVIPANSLINDQVSTQLDADFRWMAVVVNTYTSINFTVRFSINGLYYLSSTLLQAAAYSSDPSAPWPIIGNLIVPAGARITVDLQDYSGAQNTVEILFRGMKLYKG
jgi:hypothetical protein